MSKQIPQYGVHPGVAMAAAMIEASPAKTGRSLAQWLQELEQRGPGADDARRSWLRSSHKLSVSHADLIVERAAGRGVEDTDPQAYLAAAAQYVEAMYAGPKAGLRPLHDQLLREALVRHADLKACPCRTIVPIYRRHVIAQIKPTTRTRVDFGLALKGAQEVPPARLIATGGLEKGDRITHQFRISDLADIDAEVWQWFEIAYALNQ